MPSGGPRRRCRCCGTVRTMTSPWRRSHPTRRRRSRSSCWRAWDRSRRSFRRSPTRRTYPIRPRFRVRPSRCRTCSRRCAWRRRWPRRWTPTKSGPSAASSGRAPPSTASHATSRTGGSRSSASAISTTRRRRASGNSTAVFCSPWAFAPTAASIVEMASPYAPFPPEIKRDTDILYITRTWTFAPGDSLISQ